MERGIRLSPKYGVNPAVPVCFYCWKEKNEVILAGKIGEEDIEAPKGKVWDMEPCEGCKGWMKEGVILISVKDGETGGSPWRTGGWVVVKEEAVKRMFQGEIMDGLLRVRVGYVEDKVWDMVGLPRGTMG
jgi:hypothetical protein